MYLVDKRYRKNQKEEETALHEMNLLRAFLKESLLSNVHKATTVPLSVKPSFYEIKPHIFERDYVTNVLGVDLPLNESYPYTGPVYNQILKEQRLLEDFFRYSDDQVWLLVEQDEEEDESPWSWTSAIRLAGDVKTAAAAMKVMAMDPKKIGTFIAGLMDVVAEPFEKMKKFFTFLIEKGQEWGIKIFKKLGGYAEKIWDWIEAAVDKAKNMSGWKKALAVATVAVGLKFAWGQMKDLITDGFEKVKEFAAIVVTAQESETNESYVHSMGLIAAVYRDEDHELNEFNPFKKKDKWAEEAEKIDAEEEEEKGLSDEEKREKRAKKKSDAADEKEGKSQEREEWAEDPEGKAEEKVEEIKNSWWGQLGLSAIPDDLKEKGKEIITWLKDKIIKGLVDKAKEMFADMAANAAASAASGGVTDFFKGLGKLYTGTGFVLKTLRPALQQIAEPSEIEDEIKEEGDEEEFWTRGTDEADKDKKKKEEKNEALLRRVVREALILEKKWTDMNAPKGQTIPLTPEDFELEEPTDERDLDDEIFDLIQNAYSDVEISPGRTGNIKVQSPEDLPGKYTMMKAADLDSDPEPDYFRGGKMRGGRYKMGIVGHDGSKAAIDMYMEKTAEGLLAGDIAEMSGKIATIMITRYGVPAVTSKEQVEAMLGKSVEWVGRHPSEQYAKKYGPGYEGFYMRGITGAASASHMKILLGGG